MRLYKNINRSVAISKKKKSLVEMPFDISIRLYSLLADRKIFPFCQTKKSLTLLYQTYASYMAENGGFEPPQLLHPNGFRNHPLQPLE